MTSATQIQVSSADAEDLPRLAMAFETWPKPAALFARYGEEQRTGSVDLLIARDTGECVGYCLIEWQSAYPPFRDASVPEIVDLNVLPTHRGRGAGRLLLIDAERRIGVRSAVAGLRVGLYADYGTAQQMYVRHGYLPDGRGVTIAGAPVPPGARIILDDEPVLAFTRRLR